MPDEKLEEIIQHYPPGDINSKTPYKRALAEKHRRQKAREEAEEEWRIKVQSQLKGLKKPHPASFLLLVASVVFAFVAAVAGLLALPQVLKAFYGSPQAQGLKEQSHPNEKLSQTPKPEQPVK